MYSNGCSQVRDKRSECTIRKDSGARGGPGPPPTATNSPIPIRLRSVPKPSVSRTVRAPAPRCEHLRTNANRTAIRPSVRARVVHVYAPLFVRVKHQRRHDQLPPCLFCALEDSDTEFWESVLCCLDGCMDLVSDWKRSIGEWCYVQSAFINLVAYAPVG